MAAGFSLKDQLFNVETVGHLGQLFEAADVFAAKPFVDDVMAGMLPLELKARINFIATVLAKHLPADFPQAAAGMRKALPPPLDPNLTDDDFGDFIYAPLGVYVETHGIPDHIALSLDMMAEITKRFSMEFSIRAFLNHDQDAVMARMHDWAQSDNYHLRRFASEGTRPRLPWGQNVGLTTAETLPLLDMLHADSTRYVVRSVANHLNDVTKFDPDIVVDRLESWRKMGKQDPKELAWLAKHALRGLIKSGHPAALAHLGYKPDVAVDVTQFDLSHDALKRGEHLTLDITLVTAQSEPLIIDYVIDFMKSNGKTAPKVSKLKVLTTKSNDPVALTKKHHFKDDATTFKLYPGAHQIHLQINGQIVASRAFTLT
jgi:3-methyladenine DNA glycosylase AlkC